MRISLLSIIMFHKMFEKIIMVILSNIWAGVAFRRNNFQVFYGDLPQDRCYYCPTLRTPYVDRFDNMSSIFLGSSRCCCLLTVLWSTYRLTTNNCCGYPLNSSTALYVGKSRCIIQSWSRWIVIQFSNRFLTSTKTSKTLQSSEGNDFFSILDDDLF